MAGRTHPLSFYDLPCELRDMIYELTLPEDRIISFSYNPQRLEEYSTLVMCCVQPLAEEMEEIVFHKCGARNALTPDKATDLPRGTPWWRFQWICVELQHYDYNIKQPNTTGKLVHILRTGRRKLLPHITIQFSEDHSEISVYGRDLQWTMPVKRQTSLQWRNGRQASPDQLSKGEYFWSRGENHFRSGP